LDRAADGLASFSSDGRRQLIAVYFVVMAVALVGMTQIRVAIKFPGNMDPEHPVRVDWEQINARLGGASPLSVILETDLPEGILEPTNLAAIRSLQEWMEEQPDVGETASIVDFLMVLNRALHAGDPAHFTVPESRRLASQLLLFGAGRQSQRLIDAPRETTLLLVNATVGDSDKITQLVDRIQVRLAELPSSVRATVTGSGALLYRAQDDVSRGQLISISAAFVFIYAILVVMFTSFRVGLLALFPNVLPILIYFGALGASGVTLNPSTSLVGCLALGIAVDDTIHFFVRFNAEARRLADEAKGARTALRALMRPVTFTSLGLCLGFLVLTSSELGSQVQFGLLSAFTIAVAWLVDVTLSPALCSGLRIVTLWDLLTLDIGSEPQKEIAIFKGLSLRQTRIVALMGRLIDAPAGQKVFHAGEPGRGLYVMISGEVRTWVSRQEGEATLGRYERGEILGEVGLFHGEYAAHCDVEQDARMLRLSSECLEQLGRRYPRVAATLHGNLNETLAARLALRTRESALDDAFFHPLAEGGPGAGPELVLDPSLSETLAGLGIRTETLAALTLIPLVRVAWADEHLDAEERTAVLQGAESVGIAPDSPGHALLCAWLEERPDPRLFEAWRDFVTALCARLSIEGQLKLREDLLGRAREVAAAAGGFLGVGSISRPEEAVLRELESVFPVGDVERSRNLRPPEP
jgi:CRP-like cAMP-binding protein